jgi:exodeoxyribonuclease VII small subunit
MVEPVNEPPEPLAYLVALDELDAILGELEEPGVDVDRLAERVRRASELIALCRERISAARLEVEEIVAEADRPTDA